jgi:hypothetical protein
MNLLIKTQPKLLRRSYFFVEILADPGERHLLSILGFGPVKIGPALRQPGLHLEAGANIINHILLVLCSWHKYKMAHYFFHEIAESGKAWQQQQQKIL